jgi:mRNA interferase MazF
MGGPDLPMEKTKRSAPKCARRGQSIVINSDAVGTLPLRLVAPLTEWKGTFAGKVWLVKVAPDSSNGLVKTSAADTLQLRGLDTSRFVQQLGTASERVVESIVTAIATVIEYQP